MPQRLLASGMRPSSAAASTKVVPIPRIRLEPLRLCTGVAPAATAISASMRAVVVLPLVPVTRARPPPSCRASRLTSRGSIRCATTPGNAVPPPRPSPRLAAPNNLPAITAVIARGGGRPGLAAATTGEQVRERAAADETEHFAAGDDGHGDQSLALEPLQQARGIVLRCSRAQR